MHALRAYDNWRNSGNYGAWCLPMKSFHVKFSPNFFVNLERLQKSPTNSRKNVVIEQTLKRDEDNLQLYLREFPWFFGNIPSVAPKKAKSESISLEKKKPSFLQSATWGAKLVRVLLSRIEKLAWLKIVRAHFRRGERCILDHVFSQQHNSTVVLITSALKMRLWKRITEKMT